MAVSGLLNLIFAFVRQYWWVMALVVAGFLFLVYLLQHADKDNNSGNSGPEDPPYVGFCDGGSTGCM